MKVLILRASGKIRPIHVNGVDVIQVPVIDIVPNEDVISKVSLNGVNYVIIMSTTVVRYVSEKLRRLNNDVKVIGVGPQTCNEVEKLGVACIVPREFSSYGIIDMMRSLPRGKVVVLRSLRGGNNYVINELRKLNYDVIEYGLYDVGPNPVGVEITCRLINYVDYVVFMSPMTYEAVRNCVRDKLRGKSVIAIGRVTESYMRSDGINPLTPSEYTLNGVLRLLVGHLMTSNESPG